VERSLSTYDLIRDNAGLADAARTLKGAEAIGVDLETTSLSPRDGRVRLIQLAIPDKTFVVDVFEVNDLSPIKEVLEDGPVKILQNAKFDYAFLYSEHGIRLSPIFDTMLAANSLTVERRELPTRWKRLPSVTWTSGWTSPPRRMTGPLNYPWIKWSTRRGTRRSCSRYARSSPKIWRRKS